MPTSKKTKKTEPSRPECVHYKTCKENLVPDPLPCSQCNKFHTKKEREAEEAGIEVDEVERLASFGIKFYQDRRKRRFRLVKANFGHDAYKEQDLLASVAAMIVEARSEN